MLRLLVRPNIVRRFTHTHSKTIFPENNNKIIEDLIREHNEQLKNITDELRIIVGFMGLLIGTIAWKPTH
jgi:hypothetical protein